MGGPSEKEMEQSALALPSFKDMSVEEILAQKDKLTKEELIQLDETCNATVYKCLPIVVSHAEGVFIYDNEGKRYFDFLACFGAVNQGHRHPKILDAVREQLNHVTLASRAYYSDILSVYCKFVTDFFGYQRLLPMNSGVEAAETAVKLARKWGYAKKGIPDLEAKIIMVKGNFWGRTISAVSTSVNPLAYSGFGPYTPGFIVIPYDDIPALKEVLEKEGPNVAAFMVEPIQGEAGCRVPSVGYLKAAKELCEKHNCLFIADEIQAGLGRTGKLLCCDHEDVRPDILVLGKSLSGGVGPVSAILSDHDIMLQIKPNTHGSTFGGNAMGCAAAIAALAVLRDEKLAENAEKQGKLFRDEMLKVKDRLPWICSVRGKGLMNAVEVIRGPVKAWDICTELLKVGILSKPTHETTIRFTPPLTITEEQMREAVDAITATFLKFEHVI